MALAGGDSSAGPASFAPGDRVIGIDAETLELYIVEPSATVQGGAR